jgi:hypothetical protein
MDARYLSLSSEHVLIHYLRAGLHLPVTVAEGISRQNNVVKCVFLMKALDPLRLPGNVVPERHHY